MNPTIIDIDATNLIVGRMASYIAKQALLGKQIRVFNCEQAIITGNPVSVRELYLKRKNEMGQPQYGPFVEKRPDKFVRRIIKGMVQHKTGRGRQAYDRIMCYLGIPASIKDSKPITLAWASGNKLTTTKVQTIARVCASLGWKQ